MPASRPAFGAAPKPRQSPLRKDSSGIQPSVPAAPGLGPQERRLLLPLPRLCQQCHVCCLRSKARPGIPRGLGCLASQALQVSPVWPGRRATAGAVGCPVCFGPHGAWCPFPPNFSRTRGIEWSWDPGSSPESAPPETGSLVGRRRPTGRSRCSEKAGSPKPHPTTAPSLLGSQTPPPPQGAQPRGGAPSRITPVTLQTQRTGHLLQEAFLDSLTPRPGAVPQSIDHIHCTHLCEAPSAPDGKQSRRKGLKQTGPAHASDGGSGVQGSSQQGVPLSTLTGGTF